MRINGIDAVAYVVSDLERSVKFYEEMLGLKVDERWESTYAEFDVGGSAFGLYAGEAPKQTSGTVAFNVTNVEEAVAELRSKGLNLVGKIEESPVCRMAFYEDPDGNWFMLHEKTRAQAG